MKKNETKISPKPVDKKISLHQYASNKTVKVPEKVTIQHETTKIHTKQDKEPSLHIDFSNNATSPKKVAKKHEILKIPIKHENKSINLP